MTTYFTVFNIYNGSELTRYNSEELSLNKLISKLNFGSEILVNKNIVCIIAACILLKQTLELGMEKQIK